MPSRARWLVRVVGSLPLLTSAACDLLSEPKPDVEAKKTYADHGMSFDYPGNWKYEAEVTKTEGIETVIVTVESNGSAIAMVQQFKPAIAIDPDEMLGMLTTEMRKAAGEQIGGMLDYTAGASQKSTRTMLGGERQVRRSSFSLALLGQQVPHTFEITVAELGDRSIAVFTQSADEDLAKVEPAFAQILGSIATQ